MSSIKERVSKIEDEIAGGRMDAPMVFTKMKEIVATLERKLYFCEGEFMDLQSLCRVADSNTTLMNRALTEARVFLKRRAT